MLINIAIWQDPSLFGDFGGDGRAITNPTIDTFIKPFGNEIAGMPAWPIFETLVLDADRHRRDLLRRLGPRPRRGRRGRRRDRRGRHRLTRSTGEERRRRGERSARRLLVRQERT